jgi:hypothetical protein
VDTPNNIIRKYINGVLVGTQSATSGTTAALDGRWALAPGSTAELFNDDNGETAIGYVNSIELRNAALNSPQMMAFGGPSASGIPENIPPVPSFVESWIPVKPLALGSTDVGAVIYKGDSTVTSIELRLDGVLQSSPTITMDADRITVRKTPAAPFVIGSKHTIQISYTDSQTGGTKTFSQQFDVAVFLEDFDGLTLGLNVEEGVLEPPMRGQRRRPQAGRSMTAACPARATRPTTASRNGPAGVSPLKIGGPMWRAINSERLFRRHPATLLSPTRMNGTTPPTQRGCTTP